MSWKESYQQKLKSMQEAAALIESGDRCFISPVSSAPPQLVDAICDRYQELKNVYVYSGLTLYPFKFMTSPDFIGKINYESFFYGPVDRKLQGVGNVRLNSIQFANLGRYLLDKSPEGARINVVLADVSMPDEDGYMYWGPMGVSGTGPLAAQAEKVIVQVNKFQPRAFGHFNKIHVNDVTAITEFDHPLPELPEAPISDVEKKIAEHILPLIPDGSCIQIGFGGLSNAVGYGLENKKNLSVHTEMFTESMLHLYKKGCITGKIVAGFGLGSKEVYDFVGQGKAELAPIWEVNNPYEVAKNDNFMSINACLMVDLTGQVCSEGVGHGRYSSVGGQVDYVRGAGMSKGGKSFLCLASASLDKRGNLRSSIVIQFPPGQVVTTPRTDVMYIVTEYGVANVYNKPIHERVEAIISVAHPNFRDQLRFDAKTNGLI
ncbi:acetyl-CoA hydrolase/transferase family protein [Aquiflexum lacus]|uniref:acetyl-CoA hydrolase/transferase family protein n=1 Tax=Aquiflexum lacus TaxID=2483805 RepID=UPI001895560D|nr:acetyl-CoA hydrolase/transferase C-terminal domain-containing protein [Aquiflexum lacus]